MMAGSEADPGIMEVSDSEYLGYHKKINHEEIVDINFDEPLRPHQMKS